jgi:hypothetical protein
VPSEEQYQSIGYKLARYYLPVIFLKSVGTPNLIHWDNWCFQAFVLEVRIIGIQKFTGVHKSKN